jgi:hypothetical protein
MSKNSSKAQAQCLREWQREHGIPKPKQSKVQIEIINTKIEKYVAEKQAPVRKNR